MQINYIEYRLKGAYLCMDQYCYNGTEQQQVPKVGDFIKFPVDFSAKYPDRKSYRVISVKWVKVDYISAYIVVNVDRADRVMRRSARAKIRGSRRKVLV